MKGETLIPATSQSKYFFRTNQSSLLFCFFFKNTNILYCVIYYTVSITCKNVNYMEPLHKAIKYRAKF